MEIARRSHRYAHIASRMLRRVRDFGSAGRGRDPQRVADGALTALGDRIPWGWTPSTTGCSGHHGKLPGGGPVGLETLAATINEESVTLEGRIRAPI